MILLGCRAEEKAGHFSQGEGWEKERETGEDDGCVCSLVPLSGTIFLRWEDRVVWRMARRVPKSKSQSYQIIKLLFASLSISFDVFDLSTFAVISTAFRELSKTNNPCVVRVVCRMNDWS